MLNHIVLMGRLTKDPELRSTPAGVAVASFRLAVDRDFGGKDGGEKQTDFIDVVAWRQTAEFVSKFFSKGSMAVVSGRLQMREWQDKEGNKRVNYEVVAENIYFGESKNPRNDGETGSFSTRAPSREGSQRAKGPRGGYEEIEDVDGELPF